MPLFSKLEPVGDELAGWLKGKDQGGQGMPLEQARAQLKAQKGIRVSKSRLGSWWSRRQREDLRGALMKGEHVPPTKIGDGTGDWGQPGKARPSKLDRFAPELDVWLTECGNGGDGISCRGTQKLLAERGLKVSERMIRHWWSARKKRIQDVAGLNEISAVVRTRQALVEAAGPTTPKHEAVLNGIGMTADVVQNVTRIIGRKPSRDLKGLIDVIIDKAWDVAEGCGYDPALIAATSHLAQTAIKAGELSVKQAAEKLAERKFQYDATQQCERAYPRIRNVLEASDLSNDEKTDRLGRILFGENWDK
jgi:hypothetical protein